MSPATSSNNDNSSSSPLNLLDIAIINNRSFITRTLYHFGMKCINPVTTLKLVFTKHHYVYPEILIYSTVYEENNLSKNFYVKFSKSNIDTRI